MRALLLVALASGVGHAEDFVTLDRLDAHDRFGAEISYFTVRNTGQFGRLDVQDQLTGPRGFGVYAHGAAAMESDQSSGAQTFALGNLELGGLWSDGTYTVHLGLVAPTGGSDPMLQTLPTRLGDAPLTIQDATTLRLGAAWETRQCGWFGRIELGDDLLAHDNFGDAFADQLVHVNAGLGYDAGDVVLTLEETALASIGPDLDFIDTRINLAMSVQFRAGKMRPFVGIVVPIDKPQQGAPQFALLAGVDVRP